MIGDDLQNAVDRMAEQTRKRNNPAGFALERLQGLITQFQSSIAGESEVAINLVGTATPAYFHLRSIKVSDPDMLVFDGVDSNGNPMRLLQHYTQMAVLLVEAPKIDEQPFRIGFTA